MTLKRTGNNLLLPINSHFINMKKTLQFALLFLVLPSAIIFAQTKGNASYYSSKLHNRHTSDGGRYHKDSLTCAHRTYPFGTILKVRNPKNDREVIVKVTDRGPFHRRLVIDLSLRAARELDMVRAGIALVEISKLDFLPQTVLCIPTPKVYVTVQQMYIRYPLMYWASLN